MKLQSGKRGGLEARVSFRALLGGFLLALSLPILSGCGNDGEHAPSSLGLAGNFSMWRWNGSVTGNGNPLDRLFCSGRFQNMDATHKLVWVDQNVVFETDKDGNYRFWQVGSCTSSGQLPLQVEVGHGQNSTLKATNPIAYLQGDTLLTIHDGYEYTAWHINRGPDDETVDIDTVLDSGGSVVYDTDQIVYLGLGSVLDWRPAWHGSYTIFNWNYQPPAQGTQFSRDAVLVQGNWTNRNASHSLIYLGESLMEPDQVLDVDAVGNFQVWHYNRSITSGLMDPFDRVIVSGQWSNITSLNSILFMPSEKLLVLQ